MEWKNIYRGILMGISDLIPGVSGSTIAVILGFYDRLLDNISAFFSREWKNSLKFIIPLGIGVAITLLGFSKVIHFLLENYEQPTQFFFLGLIIGVLPLLFRRADIKQSFKVNHWILLVIAAIAIAIMAFLEPSKALDVTTLSAKTIIFLFVSGWLASMAMLLPGISGSFVLLLLGVYEVAIGALSSLNIPVIIIIGCGVMIGFVVSSKAIKYLLHHYHTMMYAIIIGLVIGSLFAVYPGIPGSIALKVASLLTFAIGFVIVSYLNKLDKE
ncbi:MAG: DUF368 domain-containing protein [Bacillaceae bacterium]